MKCKIYFYFEIVSTQNLLTCIKNLTMYMAVLQRSWPSPSNMKASCKLLMIVLLMFPKQRSNFANYPNLKQCYLDIVENLGMKGARRTSLCHYAKIMKSVTT